MSSTRYAENQDIAHAPERNLSDPKHRPLNASLALVAQYARAYDQRTREACIWLANFAANSQAIQLCWQRRGLPDPIGTVGRIREVDLADRLGLEPRAIYAALTDHKDADLPRFVEAVEKYRAHFESQLPPLVKTADTATIKKAFFAASEEHQLCTIEAKWRHGKTEETQRLWLTNLHRAIWVHTPVASTEKDFLYAIGAPLGIGVGAAKKAPVFRQQISGALGIGLVSVIFWEEGHNLWPPDVCDSRPDRADYARQLCDSKGVGQLIITTEQFALNLELAVRNNARWAPGQFIGRRNRFKLRDAHTDAEIKAIAKLHGGAFLADSDLPALVAYARGNEGYLGSMVNAIRIAIREAKSDDRARCTAADLAAAMKDQATEERIVNMAANLAPRRRVRRATLKAA